MKFVQVCHHPFPSIGGPAKTYRQFYDAVGARTIGFVAPNIGAGEKSVVPLASEVRVYGGKVGRYYYAPASRLKEAEQEIKHADFVLLHGLFTYPPVWAAQVCWKYRVPYAVALHGYLDPWALKKSRLVKQFWLRLCGNEMLRGASAVICATQREANKVAPYLRGCGPTKVISWACEIPDPNEIDLSRDHLRRELGFQPLDRVLVFFGRFHSMKRPLETVRLLAKQGGPNLKLLMIGPDDDVSRAQLEAEARKQNWNGLRAVGPVFGDEKFKYLGAADAYISLSHRENFNYSLAEAMASGLPPMLSAGNDLGWAFVDEGFSWQLNSDEPIELRRALEDFIQLPSIELRRRGVAAREWAQRNLSLARLQAQLEGLGVGPEKSSMEPALLTSRFRT